MSRFPLRLEIYWNNDFFFLRDSTRITSWTFSFFCFFCCFFSIALQRNNIFQWFPFYLLCINNLELRSHPKILAQTNSVRILHKLSPVWLITCIYGPESNFNLTVCWCRLIKFYLTSTLAWPGPDMTVRGKIRPFASLGRISNPHSDNTNVKKILTAA